MQNAGDRGREPMQSNSGTRNRERYASRPSISDDEGDEGEQEDGPPPAKRALFSGDDESVMDLEDVQKFLDEQQVGDGAGIELVEDDMLGEYAQGLQLTDKVGDDIPEPLANLLSSMLTKRMDEAGLVKKAELYPRPSNLPPLVTPTVNVEIWDQIQKGTRSRDIKMQKGQNSTVKGLSALTKLAGVLLEAKNKKTAVSVPECLRICLGAFALFANGNQEFNSRRKEGIKPDLNVKFKDLAKNTVITDKLFGDDLSQQVKDINETAKMAMSMAKGNNRPNMMKGKTPPSKNWGPPRRYQPDGHQHYKYTNTYNRPQTQYNKYQGNSAGNKNNFKRGFKPGFQK